MLLLAFSLPAKAQDFQWSEVVNVDSVSASVLYGRAIEWANENFKSSKAVIQSADKATGVILCKGALHLSLPAEDWVFFSFNIAIKDGKYKYVFKDFYHEGRTEGRQRNGGPLSEDKPDCGGFRMTGRYWQRIKDRTESEVKEFVASLLKSMKSKSLSEDF